jgi:hypothetical protein
MLWRLHCPVNQYEIRAMRKRAILVGQPGVAVLLKSASLGNFGTPKIFGDQARQNNSVHLQ